MIYRILGELSIEADGSRLRLPSGHQLTVLAVLLINANKRVSATDLLRAAWGNAEVSLTQLHKSISSLRRVLAALGREGDLVTHPGYGYELRAAEDDLDRLVFERLIRDADRVAAQRHPDEEIELLRAALRLWTGPSPLAGVPNRPFQREATHLEQRRKRAAVRLFELELARGRAGQILDDLHTMTGYHPTDRRLCEQLMLALYRCGHAADAMEAYERHAEALGEESGAVPEPSLRSLRYAIARTDEAAIAQYERGSAATQPVMAPRQLPADTPDLVGRDEAAAEAVWLLGREARGATPVVVITGPGGIGKTALAVHIAHRVRGRYPDGQLFVELSDLAAQHLTTEELLAQILRGFGVSNVPDTRPERAAMYRTLLGERQVLLVLDDARDEAQLRDLIPGNPACAVLITARQRLPNIDGAHHLPSLRPLEPPEATTMFRRAVQRSGIDPDSEPDAVARIVALCAGLPLALAIVAALRGRDPGRSTADIADRLARQPLGGLVYGDRSVALSIAVGFDRLDEEAQLLFAGLGLLRLPDFGLWTAAAILHDCAEPGEVLSRLADSHMIQPTGQGTRYRFHDLTRQYARARAERHHASAHERRAVVERVYGGLLTLARRAHHGIYAGDFDQVDMTVPQWPAPSAVLADVDRDPLAWYERERVNIRTAVRHAAELGLTDVCWGLTVAAHEFYTLNGYFDDWSDTSRVALEACRATGNQRGEAATTVMLAQPALVASNRADAPGVADLTRAVTIFEQLGDQHGHAIALRTLATGLRRRGQFNEALSNFVEALKMYEASGDTVGRWQALRYIGQTHLDLGNDGEALRILQSAQDLARETCSPRLLAQTAYWIGLAHLQLGEPAEAEATFQHMLGLVGEANNIGRAYAIHGLGETALHAGALADAAVFLRTAAALARTGPGVDTVLEGRVYRSLATVHRREGRPAKEIEALQRAASCVSRDRAAQLHASTLEALGEAYARQGLLEPARGAWIEALARYTELGLPEADRVRRRLNDTAG